MATEPQLIEALRRADAVGNTEDAQAIAGHIKALRGSSAWQTDSYDTKLAPDEEEQFKTWKQQYAPDDSGADYDLRGAFKEGLKPDTKTGHWPDTYKKPNHPTFSVESKYARLAPEKAGRWTGPNHDQYIPAGSESDEGALDAATTGFTRNLPLGIGELAATAGKYVGSKLPGSRRRRETGKGLTFREAQDELDTEAARKREAHPVAYRAGAVTSIAAAGGAGAKALEAASKGSKLVNAATQLVKGQPVRNTLRVAATGGAVGAADAAANAALDDEDAGRAAAFGGGAAAVAGPVLGAAVRAGVPALQSAVTMLKPAAERAFRVLAKKIEVEPDELLVAVNKFKADTGRAPSTTEIVGMRDAGEIGNIGQLHGVAGQVLKEAEERGANELSPRLAENIRGGGATTSPARVIDARGRRMDQAMQPLEQRQVFLSDDDLEFLSSSEVTEALPRALRAKVAQALEMSSVNKKATGEGGAGLTVRDLETIRFALKQKGGAGDRFKYKGFANEVKEMASDQVPEYGRAVTSFNRRSEFSEGVEQGRTVLNRGDTQAFTDETALAPTMDRSGRRVGARTALADAAVESPSAAENVARRLGTDTGLKTRLGAVLKPDEVDRLQRMGAAEAKAAENRAAVAPARVRTKSEETGEFVQRGMEGLAVAGRHVMSGFAVNFGRKLITGTHMRESTAKKLAEMITDPAETQNVIAALRRARMSEERIRDLVEQSAVAAGLSTAQLTGAVQ